MSCITQGHCCPKILQTKHDRKERKLLTLKKTAHIEENTLSTNQI